MSEQPPVAVETIEQLNVNAPGQHIPYVAVIVFISMVILIGFMAVTGWVLAVSDDQTTKGAIVQTWNNLAIAVGAFWLGSSLGGKASIARKP